MRILKFSFLLTGIIFLVLLTSCDKTLNEGDLENAFIKGSSEKLKLEQYAYYDTINCETAYNETFNQSSGIWWTGSDYYFSASQAHGFYKLQAKQGFYYWQELNFDQNRDFQIESDAILTYPDWQSDPPYQIGLVYAVNSQSTPKTYTEFVVNNDRHVYSAIVYDQSTNKQLANGAIDTFLGQYKQTLTIRKIADKVSFFYNRQYIGSSDYSFISTKIGFLVSIDCTMSIDEISVKYLN